MLISSRYLLVSFVIAVLHCFLALPSYSDTGSAGHIIVKGKLDGILTSYKGPFSGTASKWDQQRSVMTSNPFAGNITMGPTMGVSGSATYFFTDHIAAELSAGFFQKKLKVAGQGPQNSGTQGPLTVVPNAPVYLSTVGKFMPFSLVFQYYIAPYGKLLPYIGAGYHFTFGSGSSGSRLGNSHGIVMQAGIEAWISDNFLMGLEVKKTLMKPKLSYLDQSSANNPTNQLPISSKLKLNITSISLTAGFRF